MTDKPTIDTDAVLIRTADVVSAYVSHHPLSTSDMHGFITDTYRAIRKLMVGDVQPAAVNQKLAVPVRRSVKADRVICLEDGKSFKSIKRHLKTSHNLTPDEYRAKWNLASDYPMTAPNYSAERTRIAEATGLGRKTTKPRKRQ